MSITINKCQKCGHEWPQSSGRSPRRCPKAGCRTVKWRAADELTKLVNDTHNFKRRIQRTPTRKCLKCNSPGGQHTAKCPARSAK